jgi:sterol 24-C-methyltransferase
MTDKYDPKNPVHNQIKHGIEEGNSLPTLTHYSDIIKHLKAAGFEIIEHYDMALVELNGNIPWYSTFLGGLTLSQFKHTRFGRMCTNAMCEVMEKIHIAPKGTAETARLLGKTGDALAESGRTGIFTPMYFFLVRKPEDSSSSSSTSSSSSSSKSQSKKGKH